LQLKIFKAELMSIPNNSIIIADSYANPAPLGLLGFGLTTVLMHCGNAGLYGVNSMILGMGIFVGGIAQVIAGLMEWKKNNTFGATAFISYGFFWLALVAAIMLPKTGVVDVPDSAAMSCFLLMWGIYTLFMFVGTLMISRALQVVFASATILLFLLAAADFIGSSALKQIAGFTGIFCGFSALYASMAQILNEVYGKIIMPIGEMTRKK
jgi:uncharacterized protein